MKEEIDKMYQEYLYEKLDLIFHIKKDEPKDQKAVNVHTKEKNGKLYLVDSNGNRINDNYFDKIIKEFKSGFAVIKRNDKYNYISENGDLLSSEWFDCAWSFEDGYARVLKNNKFNYIDTKGNLLFKEWYDELTSFNEGYARAKKNDKWYFVDINGDVLNSHGYYEVSNFHDGMAIVENSNLKRNIIDNSGKEVFRRWISGRTWFFYGDYVEINKNFLYFVCGNINVKQLICKSVDLKKYDVRNILGGYRCTNKNDKFNIKYKPIKIYDTRFVLCINKENLYLFDRSIGQYTNIGEIREIEFIDNYIFDYKNEKVYFIYEKKLFDITNYYGKKLKNMSPSNIVINNGVSILSKDEFFIKNEEIIKNNTTKIRSNVFKTDGERLQEFKEERELENKRQEIIIDEAIRSIMNGIEKIEEYEKKTGKVKRINVNNLFVDRGSHKEIKPLYLTDKLLRHIDLSMETFDGVKLDGIDFRGSNIHLYPQKVYGKSLKDCNFEGINIPPFMDFTDVDIRGTRFSRDNDPKTLDGYNTTFKNAIYDENTTYDGISFVELYGECEKTMGNTK